MPVSMSTILNLKIFFFMIYSILERLSDEHFFTYRACRTNKSDDVYSRSYVNREVEAVVGRNMLLQQQSSSQVEQLYSPFGGDVSEVNPVVSSEDADSIIRTGLLADTDSREENLEAVRVVACGSRESIHGVIVEVLHGTGFEVTNPDFRGHGVPGKLNFVEGRAGERHEPCGDNGCVSNVGECVCG